jgi:hypothetical protein
MTGTNADRSGGGRPARILVLAALLGLAAACEEVTVSVLDVASVTVDPGNVTLVADASTRLTAIPRDANGRSLSGRSITWSSENPGVAAVTPSGTVQAVAPGEARIVAQAEGVSGTAQVTVQPGPRIVLSRSTMEFTGPRGGGVLPAEAVQVTNGGGGSLSGLAAQVEYGTGQAGGWLTAELQGTTAPASLVIRATPGALAAGSHTARIRITAQGPGVAPGFLDVTLVVQTAPPLLQVSPEAVGFASSEGQGAPAPQAVSVTNAGGGTIGSLSTAIQYASGQPEGWLTAGLDGTTAPTSLRLQVDPTGLLAEVYDAEVRVSSPDTPGGDARVQVRFRVGEPPPRLAFLPSRVLVVREEEATPPAPVRVAVENVGGGAVGGMTVRTEFPPGEPQGWVTAALEGSNAPSAVALVFQDVALPLGSQVAQVLVDSPDAANTPVALEVEIQVIPRPSATTSTLTADPDSIPADGVSTSTVTVILLDPRGVPLGRGGDDVEVIASTGSTGATADLGDGRYRAILTSSPAEDVAAVTALLRGVPLADTARVVFGPRPVPDAGTSELSVTPDTLAIGDTATVTVQLRDADGAALTTSGDAVFLATTLGILDPAGGLSSDGVFAAAFTADSVGTAEITAYLGTDASGDVIGTATVTVEVAPEPDPEPDAGTSELSVTPDTLAIGDTATVTVQLRDADGAALTTSGDAVFLATTLGILDPAGGLSSDGVFAAAFTADSAGTAEITAYLGTDASGDVIGTATVTVEVAPEPDPEPDAGTSELSVTPDTLAIGDTATVTVQLRDADGVALTTSGDAVFLATTLGILDPAGGLSTDGVFAATFTADSAGTAGITAYLGTDASGDVIGTAIVTVEAGDPDPGTSELTMELEEGETLAPDGTLPIRIQLRDADGYALARSGDVVYLTTTLGSLDPPRGETTAGSFESIFSAGEAGSAEITAFLEVDGAGVEIGRLTVKVEEPAPDAQASELTVASARLAPNATTQVRVQLRDREGNALTTSGVSIFLTTTRGQIIPSGGETTNGIFEATFSSSQNGSTDIAAYLGTDATAPLIGVVTVVVQSSGSDGLATLDVATPQFTERETVR